MYLNKCIHILYVLNIKSNLFVYIQKLNQSTDEVDMIQIRILKPKKTNTNFVITNIYILIDR